MLILNKKNKKVSSNRETFLFSTLETVFEPQKLASQIKHFTTI